MAPRSPLLDHPQYAQICLQIREWVIERRTVDYIWQGLLAPPWELKNTYGEPISRSVSWNYTQHVLKGMAKAEAKVGQAKRIAQHIATLNHTIALGYDGHEDGGVKYAELATAVARLVELQARIDGSLSPTQLELKASPGSMYARPPEHLVAVLEASMRVQEQLAEEAP